MKTNYKLPALASKLLLFALVALPTTTLWAQPVVKVPPTCNVVVPGTGGTVGFGGNVGSNGIVVMPDPSTAANFSVLPMGNNILGWRLYGDLSVGPISQPAPAVQNVASGVINAVITSYNKAVRVSEQTAPSASYLARSKGRIIINYSNPSTTCGGSITFDIYKRYVNSGWPNTGTQDGYVPPIIGPDCFAPATAYTYSVDQVASDNYTDAIGGDNYYWSISPSLGTFYNSADFSSITFTTPSSLSGPYTIQCCYGRANPWDANTGTPTTCVTKVIGLQPTAPSFSTPPPTCVLTSATSFNIGINAVPGYVYSWATSNPLWLLTPSGSQGQNLAVSSIGQDPGIITLTITNGTCDPKIITYAVNRQFDAAVSIVTNPAAVSCVTAGVATNFLLSTGLQNTTCWTVPSGWSITNPNGSGSSVDITPPAGTSPGAYVISAKSCACPAGVVNYTVNVRPGTPVISGPACVVRNGGPTVVYNISGAPGAASYTWTTPAGWNCTAGCTSTSITLQPGGTTNPPQNISVIAVGANGCNTASANFPVSYSPITPSGITPSCWNFGVAGNTTITVTNAPSPFYGSYTVTSSPAGLITGTSVSATGVITLTTSATAPSGAYTLSITHTTGAPCGNSTTANFPITYNGNGTVLSTVYNPGAGGPDVYITSSAPVGSTYQWFMNGSALTGQTGPVLSLTGSGPAPISVCVEVSNGGCMTRLCANPPGTHNLTQLPNSGEMSDPFHTVEVFPNPNNGEFTLKIPAFEREAIVTMIDASGKEIATHRLKEGDNRISERNLQPGEYFLILNIDGLYNPYKVQVSQK